MKQELTNNNSRSVLKSTGHTKDIPEIASRLCLSSVSVIKEMMLLGAQEEAHGKKIVSLGVGIPFYKAPLHIHEHVKRVLSSKSDIDKYTFFVGIYKLRKIFARQSSKALGIPVSADEIVVTPGSMAALFYSMLALINEGDEVILPSPYFSSHAEQIMLASGKVIPIPMVPDKETVYRLNLDKIAKAINSKTKAIVINSPHNPTGAVFRRDELQNLADLLKGKNIYLITDEVYDYLLYDNANYFNIATIASLWPKVIRCTSLSKKYGMMGWRLGFLHTNKDLLMHILKIHDNLIVCAPHISQEAAVAALTGPQDVVKHHVQLLTKNREIICQRLDKLSDLFEFVRPKGAYYVFPKYKLDINSIEMAKRLLFEAGVVTVPGIGFGKEGERHLRLSFGAAPKDINEALGRIEKWWKKQKNGG